MRVLTLLLCLATPGIAQNNDWPKAIAAVEAASDRYIDYGMVKSGVTSIQQAVGVVGISRDVEKHRCAILGRLLGQLDAVAEVELLDYPPLNDNLDPYEAISFGVSLSNWVGAAQSLLETNEADRINTWNLDCVGEMGIPAADGIHHDAPEAQFRYEATGVSNILFVYGDIDAGFHERFLAALDKTEDLREVYLGSGGGSVRDALLAGREIRARGLNTVLNGNCRSACPLVFAGGVERTVWANVRNDFGFHQLALGDGTALPADHPAYDLVAAYLTEMGLDAALYLSWMMKAPPSDMYSPEPQEWCDPNLATFVQRICSKGKRF